MWRSVVLSVALTAIAYADERTFAVSVDGKRIGEFALHSRRLGPESEITGSISISSTLYSLRIAVNERWKDGHLVQFERAGAASYKKPELSLVGGKDGYLLKTGAKEVTVRGDVWPSTYFIRPETDRPIVVDVLSGDAARANVEKVGKDRLMVDDKLVPVTHFRISASGMTTDLWYDADNRLVRRKWDQNGRAATFELTHIKKD